MKKIDFKSVKQRSWVWLAIYTIVLIAMTVWIGSVWVFVILWPFFFDICITHLIPWRWWERSDSVVLKKVMGLIEDLVVVFLLVHLLNIFLFQQFKIPTSSLEKTYLVGDHLFVSKLSYGPRLPMTPLAFPLVHNQFPWGGQAYSEKPQFAYKRIPGFGEVERGDIVVFNFPAGDTIASKVTNPDYYTLVALYGRERIWGDPMTFGEVKYRPVDMRDHYVKRVVGMPGDSLQIIANDLYLNGELQEAPELQQLNYFVQTDGFTFTTEELQKQGISLDDIMLLDGKNKAYNDLYNYYLGFEPVSEDLGYGAVYHFPLTEEMKDYFTHHSHVLKVAVEPSPDFSGFPTFPLDPSFEWTRDDYGPIWIPRKDATVRLTLEELPIYERCIRNFERHQLEVIDGKIYIDGRPADTYTFEMDYYFMMGDNRHNSADSRAWGFVPEDHIVGKPVHVWLSLDKDKRLFHGKVRWNRFFSSPK
ncbi:MAG: signal peptidase I [Porphyromonas sp.]|nr:signal peptidase I [Porphyromonas sp.]